eukprot:4652285-Pyramimonas_sp.AAC.2
MEIQVKPTMAKTYDWMPAPRHPSPTLKQLHEDERTYFFFFLPIFVYVLRPQHLSERSRAEQRVVQQVAPGLIVCYARRRFGVLGLWNFGFCRVSQQG